MRFLTFSFLLILTSILQAGELPDYYVDVFGVRQQGQPVFFLKHQSVYNNEAWQSSATNRFSASVDRFDSGTGTCSPFYTSYINTFYDGNVGDYFGNIAFWNDDTLRWIRVGEDINTDNWYYINKYNGRADWGMPADYGAAQVRISPNDPARIYVLNFISADSGNTYDQSNVSGLLGEAPGFPHIRYAVDYQKRAIVSTDSGATWSVTDSLYGWSDEINLLFDADGKHVYAPFSIYNGGPQLYRSDSLGLPGTWRETMTWTPATTGSHPRAPLIVKTGTAPGVLYAAYNRTLLKSTDFGESFSVLYRHDTRISGMEALGDSLYFTDAYRFFSFINGDTTLLHSRDISALTGFFPMNSGDLWVYRKISSGEMGKDTSYVTVTITGDQQINGHLYKVWFSDDGNETRYLRQDPRTARIYEYLPDQDREEIWLDFSTAPDDSARGYFPLHRSATDFAEIHQNGEYRKTFFESDQERLVRSYTTVYSGGFINSQLAWGLGTVSRSSELQGSASLQLTGAVVDGTTYGDTTTTTIKGPHATPDRFALFGNYPNPFNPSTTIRYSLPAAQKITLAVYDISGRLVQTLVDGRQTAGTHTVTLDARHLASGVYFYRLTGDNGQNVSHKMVLLK